MYNIYNYIWKKSSISLHFDTGHIYLEYTTPVISHTGRGDIYINHNTGNIDQDCYKGYIYIDYNTGNIHIEVLYFNQCK